MKRNTYTGLQAEEVSSLREQYGFNETLEEKNSSIKRFLKKLFSPIPLMIEVALVLSAIVQHWEDFFIM